MTRNHLLSTFAIFHIHYGLFTVTLTVRHGSMRLSRVVGKVLHSTYGLELSHEVKSMEEIQFSGRKIQLNDEQHSAVIRTPYCHQRILAAAGSGKTTTLTARIAWLVERCGVPADQIVLVTFSRNAAQQMKHRLDTLIGQTDLWVGTFHGLARQLLQKHDPVTLQKMYFVDELVIMGTQWLTTRQGRAWVGKLRYIVIDEFQDINAIQWRMIERMLHPGCWLIIVGDDAQNIYTWRGSDVRFILDLHKKIPSLVDDQLRKNYRSTAAIINVANGTLKKIPSLPWKGTMIAQKEGGVRPEVHFFWRACDEVKWVLKQMAVIQAQRPRWTFAVLSRTNSDLYRLEEALQMEGRPYRLRDVADEAPIEVGKGACLDLVTLHASKGLEWDCVFLIGCTDDAFPSRKKPEDIISERRLFYVGVTRPRNMLYLSYTKQEQSLSRFIREIPSVHLLYTGLARYTLSDADRTEGRPRLIDLLGGLDGHQLHELRKAGHFKVIDRENQFQEKLFPSGLWKVPGWAVVYDKGGDFHRFLRLFVYRVIWKYYGREPFHEPAIERLIFTLRVYAEEREFFEEWRSEIIEIVHTWFRATGLELPAVEFSAVIEWARVHDIKWTIQEAVKATTLLGKLRGQLRPLRFEKYDLNDFHIGSARYMVPTEWRAGALQSWRRVSDRTLSWNDVIIDLWRLGGLSLCAEGRNAALFRVIEMSQYLVGSQLQEFLQDLDSRINTWLTTFEEEEPQFGIELANQEIFMEQLDFVNGGIFWHICKGASLDAVQILELAVRASFARQEGLCVNAIGWILPLEGTMVQIDLPEQWDNDVAAILAAAAAGLSTTT